MRNRRLIALSAAVLYGLVCYAAEEPAAKAPAKLPEPVARTGHLMVIFYRPYYARLKAAMAAEPTDARAWRRFGLYGEEAAELANLLALRKVAEPDRPKWDGLVREAWQAGVGLQKAIDAKDWPATQAAYRGIIENCNACHKAFPPPNFGSAPPQLEP